MATLHISQNDAFGRITLTTDTAGSSFVWSKSADGSTYIFLGTTGTGTLTDKRPQRHYKRVNNPTFPYTFTGNSVAIYAAMLGGGTMTLDGSTYSKLVQLDSHGAVPSVDLVIGKSSLTNSSHTVSYTSAANSLVYSDFTAAYNNPVYYKVVIDGTTTETVTTTPTINRGGAAQSLVDRMITAGNFTWNGDATATNLIEPMGAIAGAYYMTGDARLPAIAATFYDAYIANYSYQGPLYLDGRIGINFWFAYKVFGDAKYLAVAEASVTHIISNVSRSTLNGYAECWSGSIPNQIMMAVQSFALLYGEPASTYYHDDTLVGTIVVNNTHNQIVKGAIKTTSGHEGEMPYSTTANPTTNDWVYALYTWTAMKYVSDHWGIRQTEVNSAAAWFSTMLPWEEPYFYRSLYYGYTAPGYILMLYQAKYTHDGNVPSDMMDMMYSAAWDTYSLEDNTGTDYEYDPVGFAANQALTVGTNGQNAWLFWGAMMMVSTGMPDYVWWTGSLSVSNSVSSALADNIALTQQGGTFTIPNETSSSAIDNISLAQVLTFTIQDATASSVTENISIIRNGGDFSVDDAVSVSAIENIQFIGNLVIDAITTQTIAETIQLIGNLLIDSVVSLPIIENVVLTPTSLLYNLANAPPILLHLDGTKVELYNLNNVKIY